MTKCHCFSLYLKYNKSAIDRGIYMKKGNLFLMLLSSVLLLTACGGGNQPAPTPSDPSGEQGGKVDPKPDDSTDKIKEIALKSTAPTTLRVTERIGTIALFDIKANKGQTLKTADKKVIITSSNPEVLKVEKTEATVSTYLDALKPGKVTLTIQSNIQEKTKLEVEMTVLDSTFDRLAQDGFFGNSWDNVDFTHETDEENPYIKTIAEDGVNHQFYFRDSYAPKFYAECEFTFYSELDGSAHMPKLGFTFSTNEENDSNVQSVSFIYFDTDCRNGNTTFYNVGYNEIVNGIWGWDGNAGTLAKHFSFYRYEQGVTVGETFKMGVLKEGYNYHVYFNGTYIKSVKTTLEGFSTDRNYNQAAPTICGMFDFKAEVKYSNYSFTTDEATVNAKMPQSPDFTDVHGNPQP